MERNEGAGAGWLSGRANRRRLLGGAMAATTLTLEMLAPRRPVRLTGIRARLAQTTLQPPIMSKP